MDEAKSKTERAKALAAALAQIEKQFGKGSIMKLVLEALASTLP
jgi:recombination protein RecA